MLAGIGSNKDIMTKCGYRTAGEMLDKDKKFADHKRNSHGSYDGTLNRPLLEEEIKCIFQRQRELGSALASLDLEARVSRSSTGKNRSPRVTTSSERWGFAHSSGNAASSELPKFSYHAERFTLLQRLNNLSYTYDGRRHRLTADQRAQLADMAYSHSKVKYAEARKVLNLPEEARFTGLTYMRRPAKGAPA